MDMVKVSWEKAATLAHRLGIVKSMKCPKFPWISSEHMAKWLGQNTKVSKV